jgi:hypothetical protein
VSTANGVDGVPFGPDEVTVGVVVIRRDRQVRYPGKDGSEPVLLDVDQVLDEAGRRRQRREVTLPGVVVGEARVFRQPDVLSPLVRRPGVPGGAQDEELAIARQVADVLGWGTGGAAPSSGAVDGRDRVRGGGR